MPLLSRNSCLLLVDRGGSDDSRWGQVTSQLSWGLV